MPKYPIGEDDMRRKDIEGGEVRSENEHTCKDDKDKENNSIQLQVILCFIVIFILSQDLGQVDDMK